MRDEEGEAGGGGGGGGHGCSTINSQHYNPRQLCEGGPSPEKRKCKDTKRHKSNRVYRNITAPSRVHTRRRVAVLADWPNAIVLMSGLMAFIASKIATTAYGEPPRSSKPQSIAQVRCVMRLKNLSSTKYAEQKHLPPELM